MGIGSGYDCDTSAINVHKPSWYLVATDDRMIPPPAQRAMAARAGATVVEAPGSHAIYVSQAKAVAGLIAQAAREVTTDQVIVHS
jgi:pimeloyl-ACP methyl ester carboxylesterase